VSVAYYNENDPKAAAWLRELIKQGLIAHGDVDERSITEVQPSDLTPYAQCHFFAGIGGWSYALRLAGLSDSFPVWTGSCPCQPFSAAGKKGGTKDDRHLWPSFARLIEARGPAIVFGEQVASKDGRGWLAGVFADLEGMGYQRAAADLCAASVGAPHIRQRLYWMAHSPSHRREQWRSEPIGRRPFGSSWQRVSFAADCLGGDAEELGDTCSLCGADYAECPCPGPHQSDEFEYTERDGVLYARRVADSDGGNSCAEREQRSGEQRLLAQGGGPSWMGYAASAGREGGESELLQPRQTEGRLPAGSGDPCRVGDSESIGRIGRENNDDGRGRQLSPGYSGAWSNFDILPCTDGKARRVESGTFPLVAGLPRGMGHSGYPGLPIDPTKATAEGRILRLRGYGNAIVPQLAAEFISAALEALE
jgi:DNA (cytosine-5)-methyltransferase 1